MIGTNSSGFNIKTSASSFANPELTIVQNKVGINNDAPDNAYKVDVGGTVNASDYVIRDQYTASGFRSFQTVPSGVVIIWLEDAIPTGWQECNGSNGCPNMAGRYVKGWSGSSSSLSTTGGSHDGTLSATTHDHTSASHYHRLTSPGHTHAVNVNNRQVVGHVGYGNAYYDPDGKNVNGNDFTILTSNGRHRHWYDYTHNHDGITFSGGDMDKA